MQVSMMLEPKSFTVLLISWLSLALSWSLLVSFFLSMT
jgi:hypothetical protein